MSQDGKAATLRRHGPAFLTRIWRYSDSIFTINVLVLIWMVFNKTGCFQDALCGLRQTGGICRLRRRRDHHVEFTIGLSPVPAHRTGPTDSGLAVEARAA